jgi:hypothetical protein
MATTSNSYTGNGSTVLFSFTFPYLDTTDIKVSLNGVNTTAYTLDNATTIRLNTAPASGVAIKIYRVTGSDQTEAEFYPGSAIRSTDLNRNFLQTLYVTQETQEVVASSSSAGLQTQITAANNTANTAIATANSANATANGIAGTANTALTNSSSAVTTAGTALSTANLTAASSLQKAGDTITGSINNTSTGYFDLPVGSTAQRPGSPNSGMIRYNSDIAQFEGYGSAWGTIGGGAKGSGSDQVFFENDQTVSASYTITSGKNAMTAGPVTVQTGATVVVLSGSSWTIV